MSYTKLITSGIQPDGIAYFDEANNLATIYTASANKVIESDGAGGWQLIDTPTGGGASSLNDLDDVSGSPADGEILTYVSTSGEWIPQAAAGGGNVSNAGTPAAGDIAVFTNSTTVSGETGLSYDSDLGLLQFGGTDASFPALKRSGTSLYVRLANDSGYASVVLNGLLATGAITLGSGYQFMWNSRSKMASPADGNILLTDSAANDFGMLQFGGTSDSFPALKRDGANLRLQLANDSGPTTLYVNALSASGFIRAGQTSLISWNTRTEMSSPSDGNLLLTDAAGTDFGLLQFGGTSASDLAIGIDDVISNTLSIRHADDSGYAGLRLEDLRADGYAQIGKKARLYATIAGSLTLTDTAGTDFDMLHFGGTSSSFPAIKRNEDNAYFRLADDSNMASVHVEDLVASGVVNVNTIETSSGDLTLSPSTEFIQLSTNLGLDISSSTLQVLDPTGVSARSLSAASLTALSSSVIWNAGGSTAAIIKAFNAQGLHFTSRDSITNNAFIFTDFDSREKNHDHGLSTNPTMYIHSATDPDTDNTQWMSFSHDQASGIIETGSGDIVLNSASGKVSFPSSTKISAATDGNLLLTDDAGTDFGLIQLGGTSDSFPSIKRVGAGIDFMTAGGGNWMSVRTGWLNAYRDILVGQDYHFHWENRTELWSPIDGDLLLTDDAKTDFGMLQFGGTDENFPALKRNSNVLELRLANDSDFASLRCEILITYSDIYINSSSNLFFGSRTALSSPVDGDLLFRNNGGTDFGLLKFGGTTSAFPAIKRQDNALAISLADDSNLADLYVNNITVSGTQTGLSLTDLDNVSGSPTDGQVLTYVTASGEWIPQTGSGSGDVTKVGTPVDNQIGVWTGDGTLEGDTNFNWDGSKLGIGITSPEVNLHVAKNTGTLPTISSTNVALFSDPTTHCILSVVAGTASIAGLRFGDSDSEARGYFRYDNSDDSLQINVASVNALTINASQNVGIGTDAPKNRLDVEGSAAIGATYSGTSAAPTNGLIVEGNVGIGTASPNATPKLHVAQDSGSVPSLSSSCSMVINRSSSASTSCLLQIISGNDAVGGITFGDTDAGVQGYLRYSHSINGFYIRTNGTDALLIDSSQNVKLGNTSNAAVNRLDVDGAVAVGSSYAAVDTAPTDGMIVEGSVGIGTNSPDSAAILELDTTTAGFLPPRMTQSQKTSISSPPAGLMVWNTTSGTMDVYDGSDWRSLDWLT